MHWVSYYKRRIHMENKLYPFRKKKIIKNYYRSSGYAYNQVEEEKKSSWSAKKNAWLTQILKNA